MADSKPADYYIGLLDFFAVVVPGACLGYLLLIGFQDTDLDTLLGKPLSEPGAKWVAFAVLAYTLGHLLHLLGSYLLDHAIYDRWYARLRTPYEYLSWGAHAVKRLDEQIAGLDKRLDKGADEGGPDGKWTWQAWVGDLLREVAGAMSAGGSDPVADARDNTNGPKEALTEDDRKEKTDDKFALTTARAEIKKASKRFKSEQKESGVRAWLMSSFCWRFWGERYWPGVCVDPAHLTSPVQAKAADLRADELGKHPIIGRNAAASMSLFQWATVRVRQLDPAAGTELDRGGADSKFFRSLALVAVAAVVVVWCGKHGLGWYDKWQVTGVTAVLTLLFLLRFLSRRWIAAQQTYLVYVTLLAVPREPKPGKADQPAAPA